MMKKETKKEDIKEKIQAVEDGVFQPIESLEGIGTVRANRFHQNGIFTIMDLAVCSPIEIKDITGLEEEAALDIVSKAKQILEDKYIIKNYLVHRIKCFKIMFINQFGIIEQIF